MTSDGSSTDRPHNRQGGVPLGDAQHRLTPEITTGNRAAREAAVVADPDQVSRAVYTHHVDHDLPPQMVGRDGSAEPESPDRDVAELPEAPSVWEAVEDGPEVRSANPQDPADAVKRAHGAEYSPRPLGKEDADRDLGGGGG